MPHESQPAERRQESTTLLRALGPRIAMAVVVGNVIGSGIYLKPGNIAAQGASFWTIISIWAFGGLLCILGALCFAELATMLPRAGGMYVYLREAYGRPVAFLFGWTDFMVRLPGSIAALSVAFVGTLFLALEWEVSTAAEVGMSAVLIGSMAWVNIMGVLWGGRLQMVFTVLKATTLALVCAAPLLLMPIVGLRVDPANYQSALEAPSNTRGGADDASSSQPAGKTPDNLYGSTGPSPPAPLFSRLGVILLAVMWAYNGWHGITPLAEEVRQPQRNIPIALFGGVGILIALYIAANFAYHGVLSMQEMADAGDHAAEQTLKTLIGPSGVVAISAVIMCSTFGAINTNFLQSPRIPFAMGRDGTFFRALGQVHASRRSPAIAILTSAVMAIVLIMGTAVAKYFVQDIDPSIYQWNFVRKLLTGLKDGKLFNMLTDFVIFAASIFYTLTVLAVIVLRFRRPDLPRPYTTWGYPVVPIIFIVVYFWFLYQVFMEQPLEAITGLVLIAMGVPAFLVFWIRRRSGPRDPAASTG